MATELRVDVDQLDEYRTLVRPTGALDVHSSGELRAVVLGAADAGVHAILVDLREVTFVDSAGFSALLSGARRLAPRGGRLALVSTDESVVRMLRIMGLTDVMPLAATPDEAWASLEPATEV